MTKTDELLREMKEKIRKILQRHYDDYMLIDGTPIIKLAAADLEALFNQEVEKRIAEKWEWKFEGTDLSTELLSDLTALISEHYIEKAKYDEAVRQRDELKRALKDLMEGVRYMPPLTAIAGTLMKQYNNAEAAIKSTER